jgi:RNA polymerase sigma factor (sigma-70 family)
MGDMLLAGVRAVDIGHDRGKLRCVPPRVETEPSESEILATLVENHRMFLSFLERRVGDRALAEDLLQNSFAKGLERAGELRDGEAVVAWFYRLLRNAVIDHRRRQDAARRGLDAFAAEIETSETPTEELRGAICQCVGRLAQTLKPEYADVLQRVDIDGVAVKDFADERGISSSNAAVRAFRAREALRKQVVRSCGTCAEHGCVECCCGPRGSGA